jgi:multidrug resistance efflux pump
MKFLAFISVIFSLTLIESSFAQTIPTKVQGVGYIEPAGEVLRLNFKHSGIISECLVTIGQRVKKGTVLLRQNNAEERALLAVEQAGANLAKAELKRVLAGINPAQIQAQEAAKRAKQASANYAQHQAQRMNQLLEKRTIAVAEKEMAVSEAQRGTADVEAAEAELHYLRHYVRSEDRAVAQAQLELAEAKLNLQKARLTETELRAPSDGTVLEIIQREGEMTSANQPVILFADTSQLRVRAEIDENYALLLQVNQTATLFGRGLGERRIKGTVVVVKPVMGKKTVFIKTATERKDVDIRQVLIALPAGIDLPIGLETDVAIEVGKKY